MTHSAFFRNALNHLQFLYRRPWSGWRLKPLWSLPAQLQICQLLLCYPLWRSAGLSKVGTFCQLHMLAAYWICATLLATNVFHLIEGEEIHDKNIVESSQRWMLFISTFSTSKIKSISSADGTAALSSSLGKVTFFTGATLECDTINDWPQINTCSVCLFWSICKPLNSRSNQKCYHLRTAL